MNVYHIHFLDSNPADGDDQDWPVNLSVLCPTWLEVRKASDATCLYEAVLRHGRHKRLYADMYGTVGQLLV